jgi:hypothetical protein
MSKLIPHKKLATAKGAGGSETALELIYNFLNEPALKELSTLSIGGTFPMKDFQLKKGCYAKQFWFCYDANQKNPQQRIFLALENSWKGWPRNMTLKDLPKAPESATLQKPAAPFAFDDKKFDRKSIDSIDEFIHSHIDGSQTSRSVKKADVQVFSKAFVTTFGGKAPQKEYCKYPLGHMENFDPDLKICHIDEFLKQGEIHYVRYFFGLDKSRGHKVNRIRIVLFPVGPERMKLRLTSAGTTADALESNWPPPPFN